jgi:hypothetical protein
LSVSFGAAEEPTAADDKTITVLTFKPFSVLFRIPAEKRDRRLFHARLTGSRFSGARRARVSRMALESVQKEISSPECETVRLLQITIFEMRRRRTWISRYASQTRLRDCAPLR